jgi:hypothetical protein
MDAEEFAALKAIYGERKTAAQAKYYRLLNDIKCKYLLPRDYFSNIVGKIYAVYRSQFIALSETIPFSHGQGIAKEVGENKNSDFKQSAALLKIQEIMTDKAYGAIGSIKADLEKWLESQDITED